MQEENKKYILALKDIAEIVTEKKDKFNNIELLNQIYNRLECLGDDEINKHLRF